MSMATPNKEYKLYRISSGKSVKQKATISTKPEGGRGIRFSDLPYIILSALFSTKSYKKCKETNYVHTQEKKWTIGTVTKKV